MLTISIGSILNFINFSSKLYRNWTQVGFFAFIFVCKQSLKCTKNESAAEMYQNESAAELEYAQCLGMSLNIKCRYQWFKVEMFILLGLVLRISVFSEEVLM